MLIYYTSRVRPAGTQLPSQDRPFSGPTYCETCSYFYFRYGGYHKC